MISLSELRAVIDRFEEDKAVLFISQNTVIQDDDAEEIQVNFPRKLLPPNLHEGDYLTLNITYDALATQRAKQEALELSNH